MEIITTQECTKCSLVKPVEDFYKRTDRPDRTYSECKDCLNARSLNRKRELKFRAVEYKGGKCEKCGYNSYLGALEFHHTDPSEKDFHLSTKTRVVFDDAIRQELDKCSLLCANCHREEHARLAGIL